MRERQERETRDLALCMTPTAIGGGDRCSLQRLLLHYHLPRPDLSCRGSGDVDEVRDQEPTPTFMLMKRSLKVGRTNSHSLFPDGEQILRFSSNAATSPYFHHLSSPLYARNPDLVYGIPNGSMHGFLGGARGPFTPSQLMELKHQALIYTYIEN